MAVKTKERKIDFPKMKYAVKFRALLETEGITASCLSELMGLGKARISRIVNGILAPTIQDIEILKKVFPDIALNDFLGNGLKTVTKKKL
jgi:hypothetical protein